MRWIAAYRNVLAWALHHRWHVLGAALLSPLASLLLFRNSARR